jgi:hypothetical protein
MHFLETSNVGNIYGAYTGDRKHPVPTDYLSEVPPAKKTKLFHRATLGHFLVTLHGYNRCNLDVARVSVDLLSIAKIARSRYFCNTYMGTYF